MPPALSEQASEIHTSEMADDVPRSNIKALIEAIGASYKWGEEEALPFQEAAVGHTFWEDEDASESDDEDVEEARAMTNLEAIMASLQTLATSVTALQDQTGTGG